MYFSYIFGLTPWFPAHSSENPGNFLKCWEWHCYVNEVVFGHSLSLGASGQGSQLLDWRLDFSVSIPDLWGGERAGGWIHTQGQWFHQSCLCNKASIKIQKGKVWKVSRLGQREDAGIVVYTRKVPRTFSHTRPWCMSSIWLLLSYMLL